METSTAQAKTGRRGRKLMLFAVTAAIVLAGLAGGAALIVRAQLDPGAPVAGVSEVAVQDEEFAPAAIEVPAGTTVTWRWDGEEEHNVVGDDDTFTSPTQVEGNFTHAFAEAGTYPYECTLHFFMRGEVVVTD